jgi:hypothetical protein
MGMVLPEIRYCNLPAVEESRWICLSMPLSRLSNSSWSTRGTNSAEAHVPVRARSRDWGHIHRGSRAQADNASNDCRGKLLVSTGSAQIGGKSLGCDSSQALFWLKMLSGFLSAQHVCWCKASETVWLRERGWALTPPTKLKSLITA